MKISSDGIKAGVAAYWRYKRQYPFVAFEAHSGLAFLRGVLADILVISDDRYLTVIEVKTSLSDFRKDSKKRCHTHFNNDSGIHPISYYYFAVPKDLANKVSYLCDQLYPYAGVLGCESTSELGVEVHRKAKELKAEKLTDEQLEYMTRSQSATLVRLARKVAELKQVQGNLQAQLKEYKDMRQLTEVGDK